MRAYFEHVDKKLGIKKDTYFNTAVETATWDDEECMWTLKCNTGLVVKARHFAACIGFAAKRYFPVEWEGYENFEGFMCHSSFWPKDDVDVRGKKVAVIGTGATGVQIAQNWGRHVGENGSLKVFQRTPNYACPMNIKYLTKEQQDVDKERYPELFDQRWLNYNGFLYQFRDESMFDYTPEQRKELFDMLWNMGGFRYLMNNTKDLTRDFKANRIGYDYWRDRIHERVEDPETAEILAPKEPPHLFGGKRLSLEQDYYDNFNKPNVHIVDMKRSPIVKFEKNGIRQEDGTFHELDIVALATGFDSITGGMNAIEIRGKNGELLNGKWKDGVYTYLGMTSTGFPNFYFTYGPQGPTAFSNGPSCNELQGDWIVDVMQYMKDHGLKSIDPKKKEELRWKQTVTELSLVGVRGHTHSWYDGSNIPGQYAVCYVWRSVLTSSQARKLSKSNLGESIGRCHTFTPKGQGLEHRLASHQARPRRSKPLIC